MLLLIETVMDKLRIFAGKYFFSFFLATKPV